MNLNFQPIQTFLISQILAGFAFGFKTKPHIFCFTKSIYWKYLLTNTTQLFTFNYKNCNMMTRVMRISRYYFKVFNSIIRRISINMMNVLASIKFFTSRFFYKIPMFKNSFPFNIKMNIPIFINVSRHNVSYIF